MSQKGIEVSERAIELGLCAALNEMRKISPSATVAQMAALLSIAGSPTISQRQIADELGFKPSGISAMLATMSKGGLKNDGNGWNLVEYRENQHDRREKDYSLTPRGKVVVRSILAALK